MRPFEPADVVFFEALKARHEILKVQFAAAERTHDVQLAAKIAAELQEMTDKASAELLRIADRLAALTQERRSSSRTPQTAVAKVHIHSAVARAWA
jgi:hypothetical protein